METTATRNWSYDSFEKVMVYFTPLITADWMTHLKIIPEGYSEWSDTISIIVEFDITVEAEQEIERMSLTSREHFTNRIITYLKNYFQSFLNTNITVKEFRRLCNR